MVFLSFAENITFEKLDRSRSGVNVNGLMSDCAFLDESMMDVDQKSHPIGCICDEVE